MSARQLLAEATDVAFGVDVVLGVGEFAVGIDGEGRTQRALHRAALERLLTEGAVGFGGGVLRVRQQREGQAFGCGEVADGVLVIGEMPSTW